MTERNLRVFFVGDELIAGQGDARGLGWVGRVLARTTSEPPLVPLTLAMPGETTAQLSERWKDEVTRRIDREADNRLVIGLGSHDLESGQSTARSRLHVANLLDNALRLNLQPFVVGPPPRRDQPARSQEELNAAFSDICLRREVIYVDTYTPLLNHEQWLTDMSMSGSYTPRQAGYGLMAWLVLHMNWHGYLGVPAS